MSFRKDLRSEWWWTSEMVQKWKKWCFSIKHTVLCLCGVQGTVGVSDYFGDVRQSTHWLINSSTVWILIPALSLKLAPCDWQEATTACPLELGDIQTGRVVALCSCPAPKLETKMAKALTPNSRLKNSRWLTSGWCHSGRVPFFTLWLESVFMRPSVHLKSRWLLWCGPTLLPQTQQKWRKRVIVATMSFYLSAFCFSERLGCEAVPTRPGWAVLGDGRERSFGDVKPGRFGFSTERRPWWRSRLRPPDSVKHLVDLLGTNLLNGP